MDKELENQEIQQLAGRLPDREALDETIVQITGQP